MTARKDLLVSTAISILVHAVALCLLRFSSADRGEGGTALEIRVLGIIELAAASEGPPETKPREEDEISPAAPPVPRPEIPEAEEREKQPGVEVEREELTEDPAISVEPALEAKAESSEAKAGPEERPEPAAAPLPEPSASSPPEADFSTPGEIGVPGDAEASRGAIQDARSRYIAEVIARIHRAKRYPPQARWKGEEGVVEVRFAIEAGGQVSSVEISKSSGHSLLDAEARAMVFRAAPFGEIPKEVGRRLRLIAPIRFELSPVR